MCLGNYDDAQKTISSVGMGSLVGTEPVPTTPVVDGKQYVFSVSSSRSHSKERSIPKIAKLSNKAGSSRPQGHPHSQKQSHHSSQTQQKSSISPKINSQATSSLASQPDNKLRQSSPIPKTTKPSVPRPPSRHESKPKDKERLHQHTSKDRPPEKEKHRPTPPPYGHQEKDKIQVHHKTPKPVHRPPAVKTEQPSLQEDAQVKHMESGKPYVSSEKQRPVVHSIQTSSSKSPRTVVKPVSATAAVAKPSKMATPKPLLPPSPTVRSTLELPSTVATDSQRSPRPDKDITNVVSIPTIDSTIHKKSKEKKLKKKKHKSKPSPSPEPVKDSRKQSLTSNNELNTTRPKLSLHIPSKKPVAQKPSSLDLR